MCKPRYCSDHCQREADAPQRAKKIAKMVRRKSEALAAARAGRKCETCGEKIEAQRSTMRFCSVKCRVAAHRASHTNNKRQGVNHVGCKRKWTTRSGEEKESWIVDYTDQHGGRNRDVRKKKDADAYRATMMVYVRKGVHTAASKSITVAEAAESWLKYIDWRDARQRQFLGIGFTSVAISCRAWVVKNLQS